MSYVLKIRSKAVIKIFFCNNKTILEVNKKCWLYFKALSCIGLNVHITPLLKEHTRNLTQNLNELFLFN